MAPEELLGRIMRLPGIGMLTREDVKDILACAEQPNAAELLQVLVDDYQACARMPTRSFWDGLLDVLRPVSQFASLLLPIGGVIAML